MTCNKSVYRGNPFRINFDVSPNTNQSLIGSNVQIWVSRGNERHVYLATYSRNLGQVIIEAEATNNLKGYCVVNPSVTIDSSDWEETFYYGITITPVSGFSFTQQEKFLVLPGVF